VTDAGTFEGKNALNHLYLVSSRARKTDAMNDIKDKCAGNNINDVIVKVSGIIPKIF